MICRGCETDLDGGEIFIVLRRTYPESISDEEIECFAKMYGWTKDNKKRFTRELKVQNYSICPYCDIVNPLRAT